MKKSRTLTCGFATLAVFAAQAGSAAADPWGTNTEDTGWDPDPNEHTYCFESGAFTATDRNRIHDVYYVTDVNSDMTRLHMTSCTGNTDVRWEDWSGFGYFRGNFACVSWSGSQCNSGRGMLDTTTIASDNWAGGSYANGFRKDACHEMGHSMGLTHYKDQNGTFPNPPYNQQDCMISGDVNDDTTFQAYGAHHKDHINNDAF